MTSPLEVLSEIVFGEMLLVKAIFAVFLLVLEVLLSGYDYGLIVPSLSTILSSNPGVLLVPPIVSRVSETLPVLKS